jgi:uncharacterized membrane protein (UPF0127 family)
MRNPALLALLFFAPGMAVAEARCSDARIDLRWQDGSESLAVEVADTVGERAQGLMFREALDPAAGMLFVYETPKRASFWMKNTLIPLDIIFADVTGTVIHIHEGAVPGDLTPIDSMGTISYVLEVNAGLAARLGIAKGAEFRHPAIALDLAAWPCDE